jgi:hypothetical protein
MHNEAKAIGWRRTALAAALCAFASLSGCAIDGYTWQETRAVSQVRIHKIEVADVGPICAKYLPGEPVLACAVMKKDYCEIIVPPNSPALVAHEAVHCLGYIHPGEQQTRSAMRK